tara:strand:- start:512 stop:703 length:192 start_codon:yes stop_codon:yes gene_type:complete
MKTQSKIKCEFTDGQLRDIAAAVLVYMSHIDKKSKIDFEKNPLIQNYLKIHDYITDVRETKCQ